MGIVASKVKFVAVAETTVCIPPLMAAMSAAVQLVLAATPDRVTRSLAASVLFAVTVTTVVVAVTPITVNTWLLKNSVSGEMGEALPPI